MDFILTILSCPQPFMFDNWYPKKGSSKVSFSLLDDKDIIEK